MRVGTGGSISSLSVRRHEALQFFQPVEYDMDFSRPGIDRDADEAPIGKRIVATRLPALERRPGGAGQLDG